MSFERRSRESQTAGKPRPRVEDRRRSCDESVPEWKETNIKTRTKRIATSKDSNDLREETRVEERMTNPRTRWESSATSTTSWKRLQRVCWNFNVEYLESSPCNGGGVTHCSTITHDISCRLIVLIKLIDSWSFIYCSFTVHLSFTYYSHSIHIAFT